MKDDKYTKFLARYNKEMAELKADYEILNKDYKESGLHYQRIEWKNAKEIYRLRKALEEIVRINANERGVEAQRKMAMIATEALGGEKKEEK